MSYAQSARATFANMLGTLDHLVGQSQDSAMADDLQGERLTEDMFPLELQFRVALNQVLLALTQGARKDIPLDGSSLSDARGGPGKDRRRAVAY